MPLENERKYVLHPTIESELKDVEVYHKISQGYIQNSARGVQVRFRKIKTYNDGNKIETKRIFTLKSKNSDFTSTEVECDLSKEDFDAVWPKVHQRLKKTRYKIEDNGLIWEVDVFHGPDDRNYFWMAEVELPDHQEWPNHVPNFIKNNLLYKVPLTDGRFSSKKLYDITYAYNLFKQVTKEQKSNENERI